MFGRKAKRIQLLEAQVNGLQIDFREVVAKQRIAEGNITDALAKAKYHEDGAKAFKVMWEEEQARAKALTAERDQALAKVEELESELADVTQEVDRADGERDDAVASLEEFKRKHEASERPPSDSAP